MTRWLDIAWEEINAGVCEMPGSAANPRILDYFARMGHPEIASDEIAWCAAATGYCLAEAGVDLSKLPKGLELRARSYLAIGTPIDEPRVGAIAVLTRAVPNDPGAGHVGIVVGTTATHVNIAGGNQSNAFNVTPFPRAMVVGYRWPVTVAAADVDKTSRIAAASKRQMRDGGKIAGTQGLEAAIPPAPPGLGEIASKAGETMGALDTLTAFGAFAWGKLPVLIAIGGVYWLGRMAWDAYQIRQWRREDAATGKTVSTREEVPHVAPG